MQSNVYMRCLMFIVCIFVFIHIRHLVCPVFVPSGISMHVYILYNKVFELTLIRIQQFSNDFTNKAMMMREVMLEYLHRER